MGGHLLTVGKVCGQVVHLSLTLHSHRHVFSSSTPKTSSDCSCLLVSLPPFSSQDIHTTQARAGHLNSEDKQGLGEHKCGVLNTWLQLDIDLEEMFIYPSVLV